MERPSTPKNRYPERLNHAQMAFILYTLGFDIIPILQGSKRPAIKWRGNTGQRFSSRRAVMRYWRKHPDYDVAIVVGPRVIMLDADTPEAEARLHEIEAAHSLASSVIVRTSRGVHHYFALADGVIAKADGLDSKKNPTGIDIRTGENLAIVPPSTGKSFQLCEATRFEDLVEVGQTFVNAIVLNNGRKPISTPKVPVSPIAQQLLSSAVLPAAGRERLRSLLSQIDPDIGYQDWIQIGMAIHHETGGDQTGLDLFDQWSAGGRKYEGRRDIEDRWKYLRSDRENPITIGTLVMIANQTKQRLLLPAPTASQATTAEATAEHELLPFSLRGKSAEFNDLLEDESHVLADVAITGQWTVIYAPPNTGKTLLTLFLLLKAIKDKTLNPERLFYINADDNFRGLTEKLAIAEEFGFHMLAPGHAGFRAPMLMSSFSSMAESGNAQGTVIVLDTLKKFVDLMDKKQCAAFGAAVRPYTLRGGTLICLAHVNKHRDKGGKAIYAGVSDILDDADCGYILDVADKGDARHTVKFDNKKARGNVAETAAYSYRVERGIAYRELLDSVQRLGDEVFEELNDSSDAAVIDAIQDAIKGGPTTRTKVLSFVMTSIETSRRQVETALDQHTVDAGGDDLWECSRGKHNARLYTMAEPPAPAPAPAPDADT